MVPGLAKLNFKIPYIQFQDIGWLSAKTAAENLVWQGMTGHLATITDEEENLFIASIYHGNAYLGATDSSNEGNWVWITGEEFSFTNWYIGEPNNALNSDSGEDFLMIWATTNYPVTVPSSWIPSNWNSTASSQWNDIFNLSVSNRSSGYVNGYFVEFTSTNSHHPVDSHSSVPESSTSFLVATGLAGIAVIKRKK